MGVCGVTITDRQLMKDRLDVELQFLQESTDEKPKIHGRVLNTLIHDRVNRASSSLGVHCVGGPSEVD